MEKHQSGEAPSNLMYLRVKMTGNDPAKVCVPKDLEMVCLLGTHGIPNKPPDDNLQSGLKRSF